MNAGGLIWKDVLWRGTWNYPGGRVLRIGDAEVRNAERQGRRMLGAGLDVPWNWEHQPDAFPRPAAEMSTAVYTDPDRRAAWARNVIARVAGFEVRHESRRGPVLYAAINPAGLPPDEVERIKRAGKVSCRLDPSFTDIRGAGTKYPGLVVSHIAVTPRPVEPDQGQFLMSADGTADETYYLGVATMAKEDDGKPEADSGLTALIAALRDAGLNIPEEATDIPGLIIAVKASGKPAGDDPDGLDYEGGTGDSGTQPAAGPPALMSQAAMAAAYPARVENDRANVAARIKLCRRKGKVSPPVADALLAEFNSTFELSYQAGVLDASAPLLARLAAYEQLPDGMVLAKKQPAGFDTGHTRVVDAPGPYTGATTQDEVIARQKELAKKYSAAPAAK